MKKKLSLDVIRMVRDPEYMEVMRGLVEADEARRVAESKLSALRARDRDRAHGPTLVKDTRDPTLVKGTRDR